jgi:hypothetical protein
MDQAVPPFTWFIAATAGEEGSWGTQQGCSTTRWGGDCGMKAVFWQWAGEQLRQKAGLHHACILQGNLGRRVGAAIGAQGWVARPLIGVKTSFLGKAQLIMGGCADETEARVGRVTEKAGS